MDAQAQQEHTPLTATLAERQQAGVTLRGRQAWVMKQHQLAVERAKQLGHPSSRKWPSLQAWLHEMLDYKGCTREDLDRRMGTRCFQKKWTQQLLIGDIKFVTPTQLLALADWAGGTSVQWLQELPLKRFVREFKRQKAQKAQKTQKAQKAQKAHVKPRRQPAIREKVRKLSEFVLECTRRFDVGDKIGKTLDLAKQFQLNHEYTRLVLRAAVRHGYLRKATARVNNTNVVCFVVAAKAPNSVTMRVHLPTKKRDAATAPVAPSKRAAAAATKSKSIAKASSTFADALYKLAFRRFYACGEQAQGATWNELWQEATKDIKQALDAAQAAAEALR